MALIQWSTESGDGEATIWSNVGHVRVECPACCRKKVNEIATSAGSPREFTALRQELEAEGFEVKAWYDPFILFAHTGPTCKPESDPFDEVEPSSQPAAESQPTEPSTSRRGRRR